MNSALFNAIYRLLTPLVRFLLRKEVSFDAFSQLARKVYVDISKERLLESEGKATTSRIAIVTGLTRKDVAKLRTLSVDSSAMTPRYNRSTKVISGWLHDSDFCDSRKQPRMLTPEGEHPCFESLVSRYSGDMPYRAMLKELLGTETVELSPTGKVRLLKRSFIPHDDESEGISILGNETHNLIDTIDHNLNSDSKDDLRFQRNVAYDNLPEEALPEFKAFVEENGQRLIDQFNRKLAAEDRDVTGDTKGTGRMKAGVGIYYFEEPVGEETAKDNNGKES
ncbi:DUF6502 family protein [Solemya velum gill symbiont]|uniref:DUF6502 family protein n=1 Tax=Solemya velum gill symbiont TaxID=2340 RepID=UPI000996F470|nr:DUF6502 family protein [Solemya velum gill symbiont]OOZ46419.1 hypothetical protein BOW37_00760 [Solemya velum gill symbiont]OOZ47243.1 hypothetical protein BOW38_04105 [Solemya velum gill symbiont]OOZ49036.1 hypothetical protein BOW39_08080 [Solemya velum gill symbiont]OOZ52345.1 hypothetical protein BOW40_03430 [Solemya velum gill symbiont]OOZ55226.1 hypothetical protein BOW41_04135 [Solemya velum gill symbiont]